MAPTAFLRRRRQSRWLLGGLLGALRLPKCLSNAAAASYIFDPRADLFMAPTSPPCPTYCPPFVDAAPRLPSPPPGLNPWKSEQVAHPMRNTPPSIFQTAT